MALKEKKIDCVTLAICLDRLAGIANEVYDQLDNFDLSEGINKIIEELKANFSEVEVPQKRLDVLRVVQVLVKGDDYEITCPNNEDVWYDYDFIMEHDHKEDLILIIGEKNIQLLFDNEIDYVAVRGDW